MDSINSNMGMGPELYAMKKAIDVQSQGILKVLESTSSASAQSNTASGADLTGLGQKLDIKA
ncbi:MAG: hypothetical protein Q8M43_13745 [Sulfuricurvum sp.]|uniref:hypothetical protein n=1 Tax=Sulfuricurvum sp. TaxID=2025608 RepID=UPI00271BEEF5|nr:hypothetical protein [Sulfuricurvum sp.]MDO9055349.1 hypothetical protein [Sulfuricurvum sp.]MDP2850310.1 hypothetical protein [Sulfuricurvum sp.]MDP3293084.1 hypothetical protein [Sulfuricurvum sp.]